jgi:predicted DNA-binding protein
MAKKRSPKVEATKAERAAKSVRLDLSPVDHDRLDRCASRIGLSMSSYARMAVLKAINDDEARETER